jgi:hypothetical protein
LRPESPIVWRAWDTRALGLEGHDRDLVRDDVVELARDPGALGPHRRLRRLLLRDLGRLAPHLKFRDPLPRERVAPPDREGNRDPEGHRDDGAESDLGLVDRSDSGPDDRYRGRSDPPENGLPARRVCRDAVDRDDESEGGGFGLVPKVAINHPTGEDD